MDNNPNQDICDMLIKLGEYEQDVNGIIYKYHVYRKASNALASLTKRIESGAEAKKLPGIGPKIAQKIDDFLQNGDTKIETNDTKKLSNGNNSDHKEMKIIDNIDKFHNMTMIDAVNLQIEGIVTIEDLNNKTTLLTTAQVTCFKHFQDLCKPISHDEIEKFENILSNTLKKVNKNISITICGEYRRKAKECHSVDVLLMDSSFKSTNNQALSLIKSFVKTIIDALEKGGIIKQRLSVENAKFCGLAQLNKSTPFRRINLHFVPKDQYVCTLLYLTGSKIFFEQVVQQALDAGFLLDKNSLRKIGYTCVAGQAIRLKHERDLFEYIQFPFVEPEQRNL